MVCSAALSPRRSAWTVPKRSTSATVTNGSLSAWHFARAALTASADAPARDPVLCHHRFRRRLEIDGGQHRRDLGWSGRRGAACVGRGGQPACQQQRPGGGGSKLGGLLHGVLLGTRFRGLAPGYPFILSVAPGRGIVPSAGVGSPLTPVGSAERMRDQERRGHLAWKIALLPPEPDPCPAQQLPSRRRIWRPVQPWQPAGSTGSIPQSILDSRCCWWHRRSVT